LLNLRAHGHDFAVEVDGKTTFTMKYCASGGMLMRDGKNERLPAPSHQYRGDEDNRRLDVQPQSFCVLRTYTLWMDILRANGAGMCSSQLGRQFDEHGRPVNDLVPR
jgi:hypothetical protein